MSRYHEWFILELNYRLGQISDGGGCSSGWRCLIEDGLHYFLNLELRDGESLIGEVGSNDSRSDSLDGGGFSGRCCEINRLYAFFDFSYNKYTIILAHNYGRHSLIEFLDLYGLSLCNSGNIHIKRFLSFLDYCLDISFIYLLKFIQYNSNLGYLLYLNGSILCWDYWLYLFNCLNHSNFLSLILEINLRVESSLV